MNKEKFYGIERLLITDGYKNLCLWIRQILKENEDLKKTASLTMQDLLSENERLYKALMEAKKK